MIFLQMLYGVILEELLDVRLSPVSQKIMSQALSSERKHRSLRL